MPFTMIKHNTVINVRKLAALDIVFHGTKFILVEFALAVVLCGAVSLLIFNGANHSPFMVILGSFFLWVSLNYVPLLFYAISIVKHKSAQKVVAYELEHKDRYAGKYTLIHNIAAHAFSHAVARSISGVAKTILPVVCIPKYVTQ
jgi:hypothetical protein